MGLFTKREVRGADVRPGWKPGALIGRVRGRRQNTAPAGSAPAPGSFKVNTYLEKINDQVAAVRDRYGLEVSPDAPEGSISISGVPHEFSAGQNYCSEASGVMFLKNYGINNYSQDYFHSNGFEIYEKMIRSPPFTQDLAVRTVASPNKTEIVNALASGNPVMLRYRNLPSFGGKHTVIITGYGPQGWTVHDPDTGPGTIIPYDFFEQQKDGALFFQGYKKKSTEKHHDARESRSRWYNDGYDEGREAAIQNLSDDEADLRKYFDEDRVGEAVQELRNHQVQMAGDISYDVGHGVTEAQYERWEDGFTQGYMDAVREHFGEKAHDAAVKDLSYNESIQLEQDLVDVLNRWSSDGPYYFKRTLQAYYGKDLDVEIEPYGKRFVVGGKRFIPKGDLNDKSVQTDLIQSIKNSLFNEKKPFGCDQCEAAMINGIFAHEHGCPNRGKYYDEEEERWVKPEPEPDARSKKYDPAADIMGAMGKKKNFKVYRIYAKRPNGDVGITAWYTAAVIDDVKQEIIDSGAKIIKIEEAMDEDVNDASTADEPLAKELALWAMNDYAIYSQRLQPFMKNYARKIQKGIFNQNLAEKGLGNNLSNDILASYWKANGDGAKPRLSQATKDRVGKLLWDAIEEETRGMVEKKADSAYELTSNGKGAANPKTDIYVTENTSLTEASGTITKTIEGVEFELNWTMREESFGHGPEPVVEIEWPEAVQYGNTPGSWSGDVADPDTGKLLINGLERERLEDIWQGEILDALFGGCEREKKADGAYDLSYIPPRILEGARQFMGAKDEKDTSHDGEIANLTPQEVIGKYFGWEMNNESLGLKMAELYQTLSMYYEMPSVARNRNRSEIVNLLPSDMREAVKEYKLGDPIAMTPKRLLEAWSKWIMGDGHWGLLVADTMDKMERMPDGAGIKEGDMVKIIKRSDRKITHGATTSKWDDWMDDLIGKTFEVMHKYDDHVILIIRRKKLDDKDVIVPIESVAPVDAERIPDASRRPESVRDGAGSEDPSDPESFKGNWQHWDNFAWGDRPDDAEEFGIVQFLTRDSDMLGQSNAAAIEKEMEPFVDNENVIPQHFRHWAVGWVEGYAVRVYEPGTKTPTKAFLKIQDLAERLENYPVLDEEDLSEREFEATMESIKDTAGRFIDDSKDVPEAWAGQVYNWASTHNKLKEGDEGASYITDDTAMKALYELGWLDDEYYTEEQLEEREKHEKLLKERPWMKRQEMGRRIEKDIMEFAKDRAMPAGVRPYGPGKFDTIMDSIVYRLSLDGVDTVGDVTEHGLVYMKVEGPLTMDVLGAMDDKDDPLTDEEREYLNEHSAGAILQENDQGFVSVNYYSTPKSLENDWARFSKWFEGEDESSPDGQKKK